VLSVKHLAINSIGTHAIRVIFMILGRIKVGTSYHLL